MKVFFELILAGLRLFYLLVTKYIPNHIILMSTWLRIEKRAHRLNPHTATGKDLDFIGELIDCERIVYSQFGDHGLNGGHVENDEEPDYLYRIRILKEMGVEQ